MQGFKKFKAALILSGDNKNMNLEVSGGSLNDYDNDTEGMAHYIATQIITAVGESPDVVKHLKTQVVGLEQEVEKLNTELADEGRKRVIAERDAATARKAVEKAKTGKSQPSGK